jgi:hypothetical protein
MMPPGQTKDNFGGAEKNETDPMAKNKLKAKFTIFKKTTRTNPFFFNPGSRVLMSCSVMAASLVLTVHGFWERNLIFIPYHEWHGDVKL